MRKIFAAALLCAALSACNASITTPLVNAGAQLGAQLAPVACAALTKNAAPLDQACVSAAGLVISVGTAIAQGEITK
jgi:L-asparagine transporter-like permease